MLYIWFTTWIHNYIEPQRHWFRCCWDDSHSIGHKLGLDWDVRFHGIINGFQFNIRYRSHWIYSRLQHIIRPRLMNLFLDRIIILLLLILRLIVSCDDKYLFVSLVEFAQEEMTMEVIIYVLHTPMGTYLLLPQSPDSHLRQQSKKIDDQEWTK